jgi:hypothetical protein
VALACLLAPITAKAAQSLANTADLCADATIRAERRDRIPTRLLAAVAAVESGRWDRIARANIAWPWTVTARGEGKFYPTRQAAMRAVAAMQRDGVTNIDVGCMQINLGYHPDAFASLHDAFDPDTNVAYAAEFLTRLRRDKRSWSRAVQFYHSSDPKRQRRYGRKVYKALHDIRAHEARIRWEARRAKAKNRRQLARNEAAPRPRTGFAAAVPNWPPRGYKAQRRAERNARSWAFSARRR